MALSVSGFPEPLRQTPADTDAEPTLSLANNAMLRGLFGKKAESKPLPRQNTDEAIPPSPSLPFSSAPRTSQMLASASTDEQALLAQMEILQAPEPLPPIPIPHQHHRPRQISLTRRTPPPVRRQPSLGRLEIGSAPRAAANGTPLHALPKPPSVVEQGWKSQEPTSTLAHPRPLPAVPTPGPIIESSKSAAMRAAAVTHRPPPSKVIMTGSSRPRAQTTAPHAVSVRYQSMAVDPTETEGAGPSSSSSSASAAAPSSSSPSSPMAGSTSTMPNTNTNNNITNVHITITPTQTQVVRPLPRIPPASAVQPFSHRLAPHVPRPARVKRPKTSPSSSAGFGSTVRSPFDAVPTSWASRPVDLNPSQPGPSTSPSTPGPSSHASSTQASSSSSSYASGSTSRQVPRALPHPHPRTRSVSRTRVSASGSGSRSAATSPIRRTLPSPSSTSTPATPVLGSMSISPRRTPTHSGSVSGSGYSSPSSPAASPRLPPPNRFLADRGAPSTAKIDEEAASIRSQAQESTGGGRPGTAESRPSHEHPAMSDIDLLDGGAEGDGDPLGPFIDDQDHTSLLSRSPSPMRYARPSSRGSLSLTEEEYLSDSLSRSRSRSRHRGRGRGQQLRAFRHSYRAPPANPERSPSPIKYARRRSLELDADVDVDVESVFGFGIGDGGEGGADEDGDGEMTPVDGRARRPPRRHTQPRSYQFDYRAAMESSPFLWNAGARAEESKGGGKEGKDKEREKEREKQRKKDTKEKARKSAGSSTVKRSKSKGSSKQSKSQTNSLTHSIRSTASKGSGRRSRSRSPRGRSGMGTPTGSVIDISSPTTKESYHEFTQGKEKEKLLGLGLGRKDSKRGGGAGKERESEKDGELRRLKTHTHMHKHKERAGRASLSGILPDVAMSWGVGGAVKEKDKEKEREKEKEKEGVSGRLGGAWRELVPLRRGSEAEWVGVGLGQVYEGDSANAVVVAAIQRG